MSLVGQINSLATRIATEFNYYKTRGYISCPVDWVANTPVASLSGLTVNSYFTATAGQLILLRSQGQGGGTSAADNGVWQLSAGAWTRPAEWASGLAASVARRRRVVCTGTYNNGQEFMCTIPSGNYGTSASYWPSTSGAGTSSPMADGSAYDGSIEYDVVRGQVAVAGFNMYFLGEVKMLAGTVPNGWLLCDGSSKATADYPDLFDTIGYTYGGSGSSFNVPNFTNKFPRGNTPGVGGGADSHSHTDGTLTADAHYHLAGALSAPSHSHTIAHSHVMGDHKHGLSTANNSPTNGASSRVNAASTDFMTSSVSTGGASSGSSGGPSATAVTGNTDYGSATGVSGSTDTSSNVPSYTGVKFVIKY